jgi:hypothetical protein
MAKKKTTKKAVKKTATKKTGYKTKIKNQVTKFAKEHRIRLPHGYEIESVSYKKKK